MSGAETIFKSQLPTITYNGMIPASVYAIDIPFARQEILGDTSRIRGELAERREKTPMEVEQIRKYLGIPK